MSYRIRVAKEAFKFSCAHMTVFPDGSKERLHGHNFFVELALELSEASFASLVDFGPLKAGIAQLCADWKERLLLAEHNPHLKIVSELSDAHLEFTLCGQRYVVPRGDVLLLPIDNATVEQLAAHAGDLLSERLHSGWPAGVVTAMEVTVTEGPGQGATHCRRFVA